MGKTSGCDKLLATDLRTDFLWRN